MSAVFVWEFKRLAHNWRALISITVYAVAAGIIFTFNNLSLLSSSFETTIASISLCTALCIPLIACFSFGSDRKSHADVFMESLPLTSSRIIVGKFLGIFAFIAIPNAVVAVYPIILGIFGASSYPYSYTAILVLLLFEAFFISMSLAFSAIFKKTWAALVCTYGVSAVLFALGLVAVILPTPIEKVLEFISPFKQFEEIVFGMFNVTSVLYYSLFTVLFLFVAVKFAFRKENPKKGVGGEISEDKTVNPSVKIKKIKKKKTAVGVSAAVLATATVAVVAASAFLPATLRWVDVSSSKIYGVGSVTKDLLSSLDEDVTVYFIDTNGSASFRKIVRFTERYCARSPRISLEYVDTSKDTAFRSRYGLSEDADLSFCMIVESERRWRIIDKSSLFVFYNENYGDSYMSASEYSETVENLAYIIEANMPYVSIMSTEQQQQLYEYYNLYNELVTNVKMCLDAEGVMTRAIEYVTAKTIPTFYFLSGHGEKNTQAAPLDLNSVTEIPGDASMLFINTPSEDYTEEQVDMLIGYMNEGGRIIVLSDRSNDSMPNLSKLLLSVGLSADDTPIGDGENDIVTAVANTSSQALSMLSGGETVKLDFIGGSNIIKDESRTEYKYTPLFTYDKEVKIEEEDDDGNKKEQTKLEGKILGISVTSDNEPVLTWITGSDTFNRDQSSLSDEEVQQYAIAMYGLSSTVVWMSKTFESNLETITPREYSAPALSIDRSKGTVTAVVVTALIPLAMFATGAVAIYSRKKRGEMRYLTDK